MPDSGRGRIVAVIRCDIALERCSGFNCALAFDRREDFFTGYGDDAMFVPFSCGGCPGRRVSRLLENLSRNAARKAEAQKGDLVVHLAACVVNDNGHYPRCPFTDYMRAIVRQKGFEVVEGAYESSSAARRRADGSYAEYAAIPGQCDGCETRGCRHSRPIRG